MSIRTFWIIGAAVAGSYGVGFLLVPQLMMSLYGIPKTADTLLAYRYFGTALLATGLVAWASKDLRDQKAVQGILLANGIADIAGAVVSILGATSGTVNALAWGNALLYVALAAGCFYFYRGMTGSIAVPA